MISDSRGPGATERELMREVSTFVNHYEAFAHAITSSDDAVDVVENHNDNEQVLGK